MYSYVYMKQGLKSCLKKFSVKLPYFLKVFELRIHWYTRYRNFLDVKIKVYWCLVTGFLSEPISSWKVIKPLFVSSIHISISTKTYYYTKYPQIIPVTLMNVSCRKTSQCYLETETCLDSFSLYVESSVNNERPVFS